MKNVIAALWCLLVLSALSVSPALAFTKESLVWKKCTVCHEPAGGKIPRVEEIRTTPEEWIVIVDRMARLHGMDLAKGEMDRLLKELCATQILTPAELDKVSYLNLLNNPQTQETPSGKDEEKLFVTCVRCHSAGKIYSYRMNPASWAKVRDFHLYMYPTTVYQMREMRWVPEADKVLEYLIKSYPYGQAWQAPTAKPSGSWLILGYEPGKGSYRGQATISGGANDEYALSGNLAFSDGTSESFRGEATLYGGHAFRTRTVHDGLKTLGAYSLSGGTLKGDHHYPAPDFRTSTSAWYPADGSPQLLRATPGYLLKGEKTTLLLEGVKLPEVKAGDIRFSSSAVEVISARRLGPNAIEVQAVSKGDGLTKAEVGITGLNKIPVLLAQQIDFITVTPEMGRARLAGGKPFPPEGVQFDTIAYAKPFATAKPGEAVKLGPVTASYKLAAEIKRPNDDDLLWMGMISPGGKYIPFSDYGSLPSRTQQAEASGLAAVVATYQRGDRTYTGKAKMVVTVPDFIPRIR